MKRDRKRRRKHSLLLLSPSHYHPQRHTSFIISLDKKN